MSPTPIAPDARRSLDLEALLRRLCLATVCRLYVEVEDRAEREGMSYRDYLATLVAEEVAHRGQTRVQRFARMARFPFLKTIEEFDFTFQSSIKLAALGSFLGPELVTEGRCAILYGPTGTGKTHLGIAIAYRAIQNGFEARFVGANDLLERLSLASQAGRFREVLSEYVHPHVLVVDEVGYLSHRPDAANLLFHVVNERHLKRRSMIFTTNKPTASWGRVLHDADLAEAILDRVLERGRLVELLGASYRTRHLALDPPRGGAEGVSGPARISGKHRPEFAEHTRAGTSPAPTGWAESAMRERAAIRTGRAGTSPAPTGWLGGHASTRPPRFEPSLAVRDGWRRFCSGAGSVEGGGAPCHLAPGPCPSLRSTGGWTTWRGKCSISPRRSRSSAALARASAWTTGSAPRPRSAGT